MFALRAWPLVLANGNPIWPNLEWAGHLPGSGPAVVASGPGLAAGNGTLDDFLKGVFDTPPPSTPFLTILNPAPSPPLLPLPIIHLPYLAVHTKVGAHPFVGNSPRSFPWTHGGLWRGI